MRLRKTAGDAWCLNLEKLGMGRVLTSALGGMKRIHHTSSFGIPLEGQLGALAMQVVGQITHGDDDDPGQVTVTRDTLHYVVGPVEVVIRSVADGRRRGTPYFEAILTLGDQCAKYGQIRETALAQGWQDITS